QMYNPDGSTRGGEIIVENSSADQRDPAVAMDWGGTWVVAYQDGDILHGDIVAKRYDSNGVQHGDRINVATSAKDEYDPDVAMDLGGNFVISNTLRYSSTDFDVEVRRFTKDGNPVGILDTRTATGTDDETSARVAMSPYSGGDFVLVYER